MKEIIRADIDRAQAVLQEFGIGGTQVRSLRKIVQLSHGEVFGKREDENDVGSYKIRGALYAISRLNKEQKKRGVVCASAGNHAQGVAYACHKMGVHGVIFMPKTTDPMKIHRVREFGGKFVTIQLVGDTFDEAHKASQLFQQSERATFIHPFDHRDVIIGQATVTAEILREFPELDTLVVPIGGGGLLSGAILAARTSGRTLRIIGAEPAGSASTQYALTKGKNSPLPSVNGFVGGAAVAQVGYNTFEVVQSAGIEIVPVPEGLVADTMLAFHNEGQVVEPAGALGTAGVRVLQDSLQGRVVTIVTGRCFSPALWPSVADRAEKFRGEKVVLSITLPDRPGALQELLSKCHTGSVNIDNFHFDTEHGIMTPVKMVFRGASNDIQRLLHDLNTAGFVYSIIE